MENKEIFSYRYSAEQNREVENIRKKYMPQEPNKLERLKALDERVRSAGMLQGLTIGIIGCLVFGIGMCFGLDVFAGPDWLSIVFGAFGICIMIPAYPVCRRIFDKTKAELAPQIIKLSDEIMKQSNN